MRFTYDAIFQHVALARTVYVLAEERALADAARKINALLRRQRSVCDGCQNIASQVFPYAVLVYLDGILYYGRNLTIGAVTYGVFQFY